MNSMEKQSVQQQPNKNDLNASWLMAILLFWSVSWRVILIEIIVYMGVLAAVLWIHLLGYITSEKGDQIINVAQLITHVPVIIYIIRNRLKRGFAGYKIAVFKREENLSIADIIKL